MTQDIVQTLQRGSCTPADIDAAVQEILRLRAELAEEIARREYGVDDSPMENALYEV